MGELFTVGKGMTLILKKLRDHFEWKNMFIEIGKSILNQEHDLESEIFSQLMVLFSEENLKYLSKTSENISGYDIEQIIKVELEKVFKGYEIEKKSRIRYIKMFLIMLKSEIKKRNPDIYDRMFIREFFDQNNVEHKKLIDNQKKLIDGQIDVKKKLLMMTDNINMMTIEQINVWLKENTEPSISLDFFNYEDNEFVDEFRKALSKNDIYIQGKTREEVMYYVLKILKNTGDMKTLENTFIINSLDDWKSLSGVMTNSIFIPNFNAAEISIIPGNKNIIIFGEEDFVGNKNPIKLKNRIKSNMYDKLQKESEDVSLANDIVNKSNGLFSIFKRLVFKGKVSKPSWEGDSGRLLIPALFLSKWTDSDGDKELLSELSGMEYSKYIESLHKLIGGEDPFILKVPSYNKYVYKIANVEESWEILFKHIIEIDISNLRDVVLNVIMTMDPIFELHPSKHFHATLSAEKPKYSLELKSGLIRSLIMLANGENKSNNCNISSLQDLVDSIMKKVFENITTAKEWFGISQLLTEMVEASPEQFLNKIETELRNENSPFWDLFEKKDDSFTGRNYYTHVLWAIEMLLCMDEYAHRAVFVLAKLSEREIQYSLSNKPISTLAQALCAWMHEINVTITDKSLLTGKIVSDYKIGWQLLEKLLPTRAPGGIFTSMSKPKYRLYQFVEELRYENQIYDTYKEYIKIAIKYAKDDLSKWAVIFEDCLFFEFELENEVFESISAVISNCSDLEKHKLKDQLRSTLYRHSVTLNDVVGAKPSHIKINKAQNRLHVQFNRGEVQAILEKGEQVEIKIDANYKTELMHIRGFDYINVK